MATAIAAAGVAAGVSVPEIMGTAMVWLALATLFVGICTCLVGRFKLATLVQYMPLPVVGACALCHPLLSQRQAWNTGVVDWCDVDVTRSDARNICCADSDNLSEGLSAPPPAYRST